MDNFSKSNSQSKLLKKIISLILTVMFLYIMLLFLKPTSVNIFNLGNTMGIFASGFLALCCLYYERFFLIIKKLWERKIGKISLIILSVLVGVLSIYCITISIFMNNAQNNYPPSSKPMIVLGAKLNGSTPSEMLTRRLEVAFDYLQENPDTICVVSGGQGADEEISEAKAMKNYLVSRGIDSKRIIEEDKSKNTKENLAFSKEILQENYDTSEVIIVTDGFHQYRASFLAKQNDMKAYAISAKTNPDYVPTFWVREWIGILKDIVVSIV